MGYKFNDGYHFFHFYFLDDFSLREILLLGLLRGWPFYSSSLSENISASSIETVVYYGEVWKTLKIFEIYLLKKEDSSFFFYYYI